jgi:hypothetical protein
LGKIINGPVNKFVKISRELPLSYYLKKTFSRTTFKTDKLKILNIAALSEGFFPLFVYEITAKILLKNKK